MAIALVRGEVLCAWAGSSLLITNPRGSCGADQQMTGFYHREARFLRTLKLEIDGADPWLCEAAAPDTSELAFNYVHPEISAFGGGGTGQSDDDEHLSASGLPERSLDIRLSCALRPGLCDGVVTIANRSRRAVRFDLSWILDADYADIQEAQGGRREQTADVSVTAHPPSVEFSYQHPHLHYRTWVEHDGAWEWTAPRLTRRVSLAPGVSVSASIRVTASDEAGRRVPGDQPRQAALRQWRQRFTRVSAPGNRSIERIVLANIRDFASFPTLDGPQDEWLALQAGMPAYPAFFGRDALTAGWQAALLDRGDALESALARLTRLQSNRFDDWRDEEPGRIPYQMRSGPLALLNINPYLAYYADYASPFMYIIALANLYAWTGERDRLRPYWDGARRILDWARELGDIDGDGYLEYQTRSSKGTKNQGWKDSGDAIVYDDGSPVPAPIATCELQGYWYIAQELMAALSVVFGAVGDAPAHHRAAAALKERFNRDWWMDDEQFVALALDPEKRPVRALSSNAGHCLACGIVSATHMPLLVGRLFAPDLFSGWGIRTLSSSHARYDPLSYHRGTVWAVEQATIAFGLRRFGFDDQALRLASALFDLASLYPEHRIPECVGGYGRDERATPGAYPRANTPQLWNATAFPLIVQTLLGIVPLAAIGTLIVDPLLPPWLPDVVLENVRVGGARVSLRFWRDGGDRASWEVIEKQGTVRVLRQPPPESLTAGAVDRIRGALESL